MVGADIDPDSVKAISEIGFVVDQTKTDSLAQLKDNVAKIVSNFDLIIDDGFHDPHANIRTLLNLFEILSDNGYYIIEDVHYSLIGFWLISSKLLPGRMKIFDLRELRPGVDDNIIIIFQK